MILTLCGFMGAGKSTIGKMLAKECAYSFVDLDSYLELKYNSIISCIFNKLGENKFRELEYLALKEVIEQYDEQNKIKENGIIISLGGGTLLNKNSVELVKKRTNCVYLKCSKENLFLRLKKNSSQRPLLSGKTEQEIFEIISNLMEQREPIYTNAAKIIINADNFSLIEIVKKLYELTNSPKIYNQTF